MSAYFHNFLNFKRYSNFRISIPRLDRAEKRPAFPISSNAEVLKHQKDPPTLEKESQAINKNTLEVEGVHVGEMLQHRAEITPHAIAYRSKQNGIWVDTSWAQAYEQSKEIALGLLAQGLKLGDRVGVLCSTREEWPIFNFGVLLAGGVSVSLYPSNPAEMCSYILQDSEASFLLVEDAKQLEKIMSIREKTPQLRTIILLEGKPPAGVLSLVQLKEQGRAHIEQMSKELSRRLEQILPHSLASIVYTSGTTGNPKGVMLTHEGIILSTKYIMGDVPVKQSEIHLMFLPMAHIMGQTLSMVAVRIGFLTAFAESLEKLGQDIAEVHPTSFIGVPRVFEKIYTGFFHQVESGGWLKRTVVHWALEIGKQESQLLQKKQFLGSWLKWKYKLADQLVFRHVREHLGGKIQWLLSGSAPLPYEVMEFFHMCGITIYEGYGLTENVITSINHMDHFKFGTVGFASHPDVQIKLAPDGEILIKAPSLFIGYYHLPQETKEVMDEEGWFHTGDVGSMDAEGFLSITDRKKDLIKTSGGKFVAPQAIERKLKLHPLINQAIIIGERHQYITALFTLNRAAALEVAGNSSLSDEELSHHFAIQKQLNDYVTEVNQSLGHWEQIKYFRILPKELTEADLELTPSMKMKRKAIAEKYKSIIDEMYDEHVPHPEHIII